MEAVKLALPMNIVCNLPVSCLVLTQPKLPCCWAGMLVMECSLVLIFASMMGKIHDHLRFKLKKKLYKARTLKLLLFITPAKR